MRRSTDFPKVNLVQPILRAMCGTLGVRKVGSQADNKHFLLTRFGNASQEFDHVRMRFKLFHQFKFR